MMHEQLCTVLPILLLLLQVVDEGRYGSGDPTRSYDSLFRKVITLFNSGKVVITDRLHASILALLMHKPHIVIDQAYKKINRTRSVAFNYSKNMICLDKDQMRYDEADSMEKAIYLALKMIQKYH